MSSPMQEDLWRDQRHWKWTWFYRCPRDRRLVVPKRSGWGWTLNFAHRSAYLLLAAVSLGALAPTTAVLREGNTNELPQAIAASAVMIAVIVLCASRIGRD